MSSKKATQKKQQHSAPVATPTEEKIVTIMGGEARKQEKVVSKDVKQIQEITGLPADEAQAELEHHGYDAQAAIAAFFERAQSADGAATEGWKKQKSKKEVKAEKQKEHQKNLELQRKAAAKERQEARLRRQQEAMAQQQQTQTQTKTEAAKPAAPASAAPATQPEPTRPTTETPAAAPAPASQAAAPAPEARATQHPVEQAPSTQAPAPAPVAAPEVSPASTTPSTPPAAEKAAEPAPAATTQQSSTTAPSPSAKKAKLKLQRPVKTSSPIAETTVAPHDEVSPPTSVGELVAAITPVEPQEQPAAPTPVVVAAEPAAPQPAVAAAAAAAPAAEAPKSSPGVIGSPHRKQISITRPAERATSGTYQPFTKGRTAPEVKPQAAQEPAVPAPAPVAETKPAAPQSVTPAAPQQQTAALPQEHPAAPAPAAAPVVPQQPQQPVAPKPVAKPQAQPRLPAGQATPAFPNPGMNQPSNPAAMWGNPQVPYGYPPFGIPYGSYDPANFDQEEYARFMQQFSMPAAAEPTSPASTGSGAASDQQIPPYPYPYIHPYMLQMLAAQMQSMRNFGMPTGAYPGYYPVRGYPGFPEDTQQNAEFGKQAGQPAAQPAQPAQRDAWKPFGGSQQPTQAAPGQFNPYNQPSQH